MVVCGPSLALDVEVIRDLAVSVQAIKGFDEALVPMTTGVRRSSTSVVLDRRGRKNHSVHSAYTGNDCGRGVAGYLRCSNPHMHSRVNASHRESRLVSVDTSAAFLSGWAAGDSASIADPGIHGKVGASNPQGRRVRADTDAFLLSEWAVGTIPVHDVSGVAASEGVTGDKESVASGQKPRAKRRRAGEATERVWRQVRNPGKEKKSR